MPKYYQYQSLGACNALLSLFKITAEEVKGELKAITAERDKLLGLFDELTQTQANLRADHRVLNKQYEDLSTNYLSEQGRVTALQTELEKAQSKMTIDQNKNTH